MVTFVFSNPRHHVDIMVPVARELARRGVGSRFISLAELRGLATPDLRDRLDGRADVRRILPRLGRDPSAAAGFGLDGDGVMGAVRKVARSVVWRAALEPRLRMLLRQSEVVVIPNDAAFPYDRLSYVLRSTSVPFALVQEGIRFPLPTETRTSQPYGGSGASALCVWGEASATHFRAVAEATKVHITGNPRFDRVDPAAFAEASRALRERFGLREAPLLYLSNTVDDMGFCTTAEKMALFAKFVRAVQPVLARQQRALVVKLHAREDVKAFQDTAASVPGATVHVLRDEPLYPLLAVGRAAVVLASTVGLEALMFGLPLAVLPLPRHGYVFEYVSHNVAIGLDEDNLADGIERLLDARIDTENVARFIDRHLAHRGQAASRTADRIIELLPASRRTS